MRHLLLLLWLACALGSLGAQEPVFLTQRIQVHYNQWQGSQGLATETTLATYDFNLGLPVLAYRLGAVAVTGSVDYDHLSSGGQSGGALGLNRYGARLTLFPYRPFHLTLDLDRTQSPGLAGQARMSGTTYGLGLNYRGRKVQDVEVSLRRGEVSQGTSLEDWSLWRLVVRQDVKGTRISMDASRQEFGASATGAPWRSSSLFATTDTTFSRAWTLRSNLQFGDGGGAQDVNAGLNLIGTAGGWTSISNASLGRTQGESFGSRSGMLSQSLAYNAERWTTFSSTAWSSVHVQDGTADSSQGAVLLGGAYSLGRGWRVSADLGRSFGSGVPATAGSAGNGAGPVQNLRTLHGGISQGGDLPGIIRRALFFLSDRGFQRRIAEEYPPGYVPSELAAEMAQRRFRQSGDFNVAGDVWHEVQEGGPARSDWARLTGQLRLNAGLTFLVIGDWKEDRGLSLPGLRMDSRAITVNGAYRFGASSVLANTGYSRYSQGVLPGSASEAAAPVAAGAGSGLAARYVSLGFNSRVWRLPYGVQWTRYEGDAQPSARAVMGFLLLNFRQVNLRVTCQTAHRADGLRDRRITVDLLRWMDTLTFGGGRP